MELARLRPGTDAELRGLLPSPCVLLSGSILVARPVHGGSDVGLFIHASTSSSEDAPEAITGRGVVLGYFTAQSRSGGDRVLAARVARSLALAPHSTLVLRPCAGLSGTFELRVHVPPS